MSFNFLTFNVLKQKAVTTLLVVATLSALVFYTSLIPAAEAAHISDHEDEMGAFIVDGDPTTSNEMLPIVLEEDLPAIPGEATLTVTKVFVNDDGGTADVDDAAIFIDGTAVVSGQPYALSVGVHQVTEGDMDGYVATFSGDCDDSGNIWIRGNFDYECVITNDDIGDDDSNNGFVTINKVVINDDGGTAHRRDFTLFVGDTDVGRATENPFGAGTYQISEQGDMLDQYDATFIGDCDESGVLTFEPGEHVECTIVNNDIPDDEPDELGSLTLHHEIVNDNGGDAVSDDLQVWVDGMATAWNDALSLSVGAHAITTADVDGYTVSFSGDCDAEGSIDMTLDADLHCTIQFDDEPATLIVVKQVVNDNGGIGVAADASITVSGQDVSDDAFAGDEDGVVVTLDAGVYSVEEADVDGYTASFSEDCEGTIAIGETKTCTIVNDDIDDDNIGYVTIYKEIVNDDGGPATVDDFTLYVGDTDVARGATNPFGEGWYVIDESGPIGYEATFSGDCDANGNLQVIAGETVECTITNNDIEGGPFPGTITVNKVVVNDGGGTAVPDDFDLYVNTTHVGRATANLWNPNTYLISEQGDLLDQYEASFSGDCDDNGLLTIEAGEDLVCTITNTFVGDDDDDMGSITIVKEVVNDDGGDGVVGDFPLFVGGTSVISGQAMDFEAGTYAVTESNADGYSASFSGDCDEDGMITLEEDEDLTCVMTNDDVDEDELGSITVIKQVINDDGGDGEVADFPLTVGSTSVLSNESNDFAAGTYRVAESNADGYAATFGGDCDADGDVTLEAGEDLICIMINNDIADDDDDDSDDQDEDEDDDDDSDRDVNVNVNVDTGDTNVTTGDVNVDTGDVNVTTGDNDNDVVVTTGGTPPPLVLGEDDEPDDDDTTPPPVGGVLGEDDFLPRTGSFPVGSVVMMVGLSVAYLAMRRES